MNISLNQDNKPKRGRNTSIKRSLPSKGLFRNGSERQGLCTRSGIRNRHSRFSHILGYRASIQNANQERGQQAHLCANPTFLQVFYIGLTSLGRFSLMYESLQVKAPTFAISVPPIATRTPSVFKPWCPYSRAIQARDLYTWASEIHRDIIRWELW